MGTPTSIKGRMDGMYLLGCREMILYEKTRVTVVTLVLGLRAKTSGWEVLLSFGVTTDTHTAERRRRRGRRMRRSPSCFLPSPHFFEDLCEQSVRAAHGSGFLLRPAVRGRIN